MRASSATASTSGRRDAVAACASGNGSSTVGEVDPFSTNRERQRRHRHFRPAAPSAASLGPFPSLNVTSATTLGCASSIKSSLRVYRLHHVAESSPKRHVFCLASSSGDGDDQTRLSSLTTKTPQQQPTSTLSAAELDARIDVARSTGRLDLSECGLTAVPDDVALLGACGLEDLSLAGNPNLTSLPEWIGEALPSLRRLQAAGCGLKELPASIAELGALEGLWVHGCKIENLPEKLGEGPLGGSLRCLSLAGNRLRQLPSSIGGLSCLVEAGLAGNRLLRLPKEFGGMTSLKKLQLHGNLLGLVVDGGDEEEGNETDDESKADAASLAALPEESLATLRSLTHLTLQANRLTRLPECLGKLPLLEDLNVADNELRRLPLSLGGSRREKTKTETKNAASLRRLTAYGNRISSLPPLLGRAPALRGLWLEGNPLSGGGGGGGVKGPGADSSSTLSSGEDDELHSLLVDASRASTSSSSSSSSSILSSSASAAAGGAEADAASVEGGNTRRRVGLDARQLSSLSDPAVAAAASAAGVLAPPSATLVSDGRRGYWKLEAGPGGSEWVARVAESVSSPSSSSLSTSPPEVVDGGGASGRRGLVVAFGSAPGEPNWGGLLSKIRRNAADSAHAKFDVLYVVDGARSWYNGGDADADDGDDDDESRSDDGNKTGTTSSSTSFSSALSLWTEPIAAAARAYDGAVLLLGDSMGATGALLCCGAVAEACRGSVRRSPSSSSSLPPARPRALAFCPQVDLTASSIRPAESEAWMRRLKQRAVVSVSLATTTASSTAAGEGSGKEAKSPPLPPPMRVDVHVGSWQHDVAQATALQEVDSSSGPSRSSGVGATVKVWSVPSHRLAAALDSRGELEPLVRSALLSVMGFSDGRGVRISNIL